MQSRHFLDRGMARFAAGIIGALALFGLAMTWHLQQQTDAGGRPVAGPSASVETDSAASANPKFDECRDQRSADIGKMLADGVIDQAKHDEFLGRAIQTCAGMFPPES